MYIQIAAYKIMIDEPFNFNFFLISVFNQHSQIFLEINDKGSNS